MSRILVSYFSASGKTKSLAKNLAIALNSDIFEIEPVEKYSDADLNWMDKNSRSSVEMKDRKSRPLIKNKIDVSKYDYIFIGFPIWWYREPSIIDTFLEEYDLSGKTIIPFATSGGSNLGDTKDNMQVLAKGAKVLDGKKFSSYASIDELKNWCNEFIK